MKSDTCKHKEQDSRDDKEKLLTEMIRRHAISPDSRNDKTLLNYLAGQKYDDVFAEQDMKKKDK